MPGRLETVPQGAGSRGVYLITHPRSASNMFQTMMSKQPGYHNSSYKFFNAGFAMLTQIQKGPLSTWPEEQRNALYGAFRSGFDSMQDELEEVQKNEQQAFLKEHAAFLFGPDKVFPPFYPEDAVEPLSLTDRNVPSSAHTNPSSIPDSILLGLRPIFQIRHPILMFPSLVRAQQKALGPIRPRGHALTAILTLRYSRGLYDWYLHHEDAWRPQVLDADDIINDRAAVRHVCVEMKLDPDAVLYEWEKKEEPDPMKAVFLSTINASNTIIPGLAAKGLDFETEKRKWIEEFGEEDGEDMAKAVLDAMPDYEYLLSQRTYIEKGDDQ